MSELKTLRAPGSGTGGGNGGGNRASRRDAATARCTADCGDEKVNPTGPGVAFIRIRRQRTVVLCPNCTIKALGAVGLELAPEPVITIPEPPVAPSPTTPANLEREAVVIAADDVAPIPAEIIGQ